MSRAADKKTGKRKASAKVIPPVIDDVVLMDNVGETIQGDEYQTDLVCPKCIATVRVSGAGYPAMKCCKCRIDMRPHAVKVEG
jgi:hypothetical protein